MQNSTVLEINYLRFNQLNQLRFFYSSACYFSDIAHITVYFSIMFIVCTSMKKLLINLLISLVITKNKLCKYSSEELTQQAEK